MHTSLRFSAGAIVAAALLLSACASRISLVPPDEPPAQLAYLIGAGDNINICLLYTSPSPRD